jgi:uncharacterized protein
MSAVLLSSLAALVAAAPQSEEGRVAAWRQARLAELTADDGWLTLVGLHWMHEGINRAGSAAGSDLPLPPEAPAQIGTFTLRGDQVAFEAAPGAGVTVDGAPVGTLSPEPDKATLVCGTLRLLVIRRGSRTGLRVRDTASPARQAFEGLDYFSVQERFRIPARFEPFDPPKVIPIANVLGDSIDWSSPGRLVFAMGGATYSLDALLEKPDAKDFFVIFRDPTSGHTTYPAGRYLHVPLPTDGRTEVDFNQAYNPPCAFTPFATCPLPPRQNWLIIPIEAGEKAYRH